VYRSKATPTALRLGLLLSFLLALAYAQVQDSLRPNHAARLEIVVTRSDTGETVPARVYLFKEDRPFRLSPVDAFLPLRADLFYRERLWRRSPDLATLEVTANNFSHFILLNGSGAYDLPASKSPKDYRLEVYRGTFFKPEVVEFTLEAEQTRRLEVSLEPVAPGRQDEWISADDHIHLMRAKEDDDVFLRWMEAEDLQVGNFLELQRQQHAAVQYAFGEAGEAKQAGSSIRSGHESRSRFYGHTLFLGGSQMVRPLSIGSEYANSPEAYPYPMLLFEQGRNLGALTGFAHFYGSQPNSTLLMNLAHGTIDFVELFQFGVLKTEEWYELLNSGLRVVGLAGSDFPANMGRLNPYPGVVPLLGPERALVKAEPGESAYEAWAVGVRKGAVLLTNGPLLELKVNDQGPGDTVRWSGQSLTLAGRAEAVFHRPIEKVEIIRNGAIVARQLGDGAKTEVSLSFKVKADESSWIAARVTAETRDGEPTIQAHTNPVYFLKGGQPVHLEWAREGLRAKWRKESAYYHGGDLQFAQETQRQGLLEKVDGATQTLSEPPSPN